MRFFNPSDICIVSIFNLKSILLKMKLFITILFIAFVAGCTDSTKSGEKDDYPSWAVKFSDALCTGATV
jgi:hypothetical protein